MWPEPAVFAEFAARSLPLLAMGLLELCEEVFGTADLYRVLGVRREASDSEVRRGYHKVSLQVHPDRVGEDDKEDATRRFQVYESPLHWPPGFLLVFWPTGPAPAECAQPGLAFSNL